MIIAECNVYARGGEPTLSDGNGQNPLIAALGTPIDDDAAKAMGLSALFAQHNEQAVKAAHELNDPLAVVKSTKPKHEHKAPEKTPEKVEAK